MLTATYQKYVLDFIQPGGTSRGVMNQRTSWFLIVKNSENKEVFGIGECPPLPGLSRDNINEIEKILDWLCSHINDQNLMDNQTLWDYPSVLFGLEMALWDLKNGGNRRFFENSFFQHATGIPINGLVWMGSFEKMHEQVKKKISQGFKCIKLKIGAIDIESELALIKEIRNTFGQELEIRVDANGGFSFDRCMPVLTRLADLKVHSIEQPLQPGQFEKMCVLCKKSPIPIALDEDIIRWSLRYEKHQLLESVSPQFLVLKPGLIGGFTETSEWIKLATDRGIDWWITSALESNVALNAIAQYTSQFNPTFPQGLGTGQIFSNNFTSPLYVQKDQLFHDPSNTWDLTLLNS